MDLWQIMQEPWALRALAASVMVGITCGVLGAFIVLRNMSMIGDALSHAILPGVVIAFVVLGYHTVGFFLGSVIAGILSAVAITWIQQHIRTKSDAVIGIVFTAMFSIGVIGISAISRTGVHLDLKDFLFGNVLGVASDDLAITALVMIMVVASILLFYRYLFASTFQPTIASAMGIPVKFIHYYLMVMLSFSVVAAMQTVGVILVVAMLITPASTALLLSHRLPQVLLIAGFTGAVSSLTGLIIAVLYEWPPGPAIAVTATCIYLLAAVFSPQQGLLVRELRRRRERMRIESEDVLKAVFKAALGNPADTGQLRRQLDIRPLRLRALLRMLRQKKLIGATSSHGIIALTAEGKEAANNLIRAHRLWESYLYTEIGMDSAHIHEEAERLEHILTLAQVDEVDRRLGYPPTDPHGAPIPSKESLPAIALSHLQPAETGMISQRQPGAEISHRLWDLGLGPGDAFTVRSSGKEIVITIHGDDIVIPGDLAQLVSVERG